MSGDPEFARLSEARYHALIDNLPLPTLVYELDTLRFLAVNQAAVELYGYTRQQLLSMRITDTSLQEDQQRLLHALAAPDDRPRRIGVWRQRTSGGGLLELDIVSQNTVEGGLRARLLIATDVTERGRLERALRESEERFRVAFQTVPDAVSIGRMPDGVNVSVNEVYCRMSGWTEDEAVGATSVELDLWVDPAQRRSFFNALVTEGHVRDFDTIFRRKDGSHFMASCTSRLFSAGGKQYFLTVSKDITDRRRAERAQVAIYRIAEAANAGGTLGEMLGSIHQIVSELMPAPNFYIALHDRTNGLLEFPYYVDERGDVPAGPEPLGKGLTEYVLRTGRALVLPDGTAEDLERSGQVEPVGAPALSWIGVPLRTRERTVGVLAVQIYSGDTRYDERHTELLQFVSSQVARAIERKQVEETLRKNEERFRALIGNSSDGILVINADGTIAFASASVDRILGQGAAVPGKSVFDLVHPDDLEATNARYVAMLAVPGVPATISARLRHTSGTWREIESVVANHLDDPAVRGVVSNFRDVTDRKQMEARLMIADRMVSVGTLAAGVAHEINNPLTYVLGNLDYVMDRLGSSVSREIREALDETRMGAERVRVIVRDLKTFSRGDDAAHEAVDLHHVLDASANMAWNEVRHRARLVKDYAPSLPAVVGNESRLGQVFLNLLINAAQAIPEGAAERNQIRISTRRAGDGVRVDVQDSGSGIAPEHLKRLFDPFFTTKEVGVGTGLGLFICRNIITALGGDISVDSEPGQGTTMHVLLRTAAAESPAAAVPQPGRDAASRKLLVIDDDPLIGAAMLRRLPEHDVSVETSAVVALRRIRNGERFDLILCDVMMPDMTGVAFHEELQKLDAALAARVVFMTGGAFTAAARDFLDRVPNARLEKPLDLHNVRALLAAKG